MGPHRVSNIFPKPLVKINWKPCENEIGLTETEKLALQNACRRFKANPKLLASRIYIDAFSENMRLCVYFRDKENLRVRAIALHRHRVLDFILLFLRELEKPNFQKIHLKDLVKIHKSIGITLADWKLYTAAVKKNFLRALGNDSKILEDSVTKLIDIFDNTYEMVG